MPPSRASDGYDQILTIVDVFTRKAWARPIKGKTGAAVLAAFKDIVATGRQPQFIWIDQGKEFLNKEFKKWATENRIGIYHTFGNGKSAIVERFNRTLKSIMWKKLTAMNSHDWVDLLPRLIEIYNNSKHGTLKMTPQQASDNPERAKAVWDARYARDLKKRVTPPAFKVGDRVRVSRQKGQFEKGYDVNWSREVFTVAKVDAELSPVVYHLKDFFEKPIEGSFYEQELQKVKNPDVWLVEEVLKTRGKGDKKELLVKWLGYPASFNTWIKASTTTKL